MKNQTYIIITILLLVVMGTFIYIGCGKKDHDSGSSSTVKAVDDYVWVSNRSSGNVTRILKSNPATTTTIAVGAGPGGVAVDETYCWVANNTSDNATRIVKSTSVTTTIGVGDYPYSIGDMTGYAYDHYANKP